MLKSERGVHGALTAKSANKQAGICFPQGAEQGRGAVRRVPPAEAGALQRRHALGGRPALQQDPAGHQPAQRAAEGAAAVQQRRRAAVDDAAAGRRRRGAAGRCGAARRPFSPPAPNCSCISREMTIQARRAYAFMAHRLWFVFPFWVRIDFVPLARVRSLFIFHLNLHCFFFVFPSFRGSVRFVFSHAGECNSSIDFRHFPRCSPFVSLSDTIFAFSRSSRCSLSFFVSFISFFSISLPPCADAFSGAAAAAAGRVSFELGQPSQLLSLGAW